MFDSLDYPTFIGILSLLYYLCAAIQMVFSLLFGRLLFYTPPNGKTAHTASTPVSVIIAARNEEANLHKLLPALFHQKYTADFEIVVVNDRSTDGTAALLKSYSAKYPQLKVVELGHAAHLPSPKKRAVKAGIAAAAYPCLLFTDADCLPASEQWVSLMANTSEAKPADIVLGYSPYRSQPGLLNALIRYETLLTGCQYLSFSLWGKPYMAVGRNWLYPKKLFTQVNGFASHEQVMSGDDDLLANQIMTRNNTAIVIAPEAHMISVAEQSWKSWFRQKRRHLQAGFHYKAFDKGWLFLWWASKTGFYSLFTMLLFINTKIALYGYCFKMFTFIMIIYYLSVKLNDRQAILRLPILDLLYSFYIPATGIITFFKPKGSWT